MKTLLAEIQALENKLAKETSGEDWFKSLSPEQQKDYVRLHPGSKYAPGASSQPKPVHPQVPTAPHGGRTRGPGLGNEVGTFGYTPSLSPEHAKYNAAKDKFHMDSVTHLNDAINKHYEAADKPDTEADWHEKRENLESELDDHLNALTYSAGYTPGAKGKKMRDFLRNFKDPRVEGDHRPFAKHSDEDFREAADDIDREMSHPRMSPERKKWLTDWQTHARK